MHAHDEDVKLMLRVRDGDDDAFARLIERHRDRVLAVVYRYTRDRGEAEDLAQDVFLNIHCTRASYRPEAKFTTWLYRIATNRGINAMRARAVRKHVDAPAPTTQAGEAVPLEEMPDPKPANARRDLEQRELADRVREAVDALPETQKTAVLLNKYEGCSYEEIAQVLDLSIPAVKSLLSRARMRIKERLAPYLQREGERVSR